jgi:hypothetical protein
MYKYAAVRVSNVGADRGDDRGLGGRMADLASKAVDRVKETADQMLTRTNRPRVHLPDSLGLLRESLEQFAKAARSLTKVHFEEPELVGGCERLAELADEANAALAPFAKEYGSAAAKEPEQLRLTLFPTARPGPFGVLRDLQSLKLMAGQVQTANTSVSQAAKGLRDEALMAACGQVEERARRQEAWLHNQVLHRSAHTLNVPT